MREFKGKLSADDLAYLRQRHTEAHIARLVELHGVQKGAEDGSGDDAVAQAQRNLEKAQEEAETAAREAADAAAQAAAEASTQADQDAAEDLIGDALYDPLAHTTTEVRAYLKTASEDEVNRVKAVESAREDREPRSTVVNFGD